MLNDRIVTFLEKAVEKDGGDSYRKHLRNTISQCEDAYREAGSPFRSHLGASLIGKECARELWLSFRWAAKPTFDGRMQRLFNRGHLEEARLVALLRAAGVEVWQHDDNGKQFRIKGYHGHFGGSLDGVVYGLPGHNYPLLSEFKTHNDKSFKKLSEVGVREAKFEHFVQMQIYMGQYELTHALYLAVNKNDDALYAEVVPFDAEIYGMYMDRAVEVVDAVSPPPRINESPGWYKCKFCSYTAICHSGAEPEKNCRTCRWSTPSVEGSWICEVDEKADRPVLIDGATMLVGCSQYAEHPEIRSRY